MPTERAGNSIDPTRTTLNLEPESAKAMATAEQTGLRTSRLLAYRRFWLYVVIFLFLDQASKQAIWHSGFPLGQYPPEGGVELIPGFFSLVFTVNRGAAWGMFSGWSVPLIVLALTALYGIFHFRRQLELRRPLLQASFGLMVAGILGNLLDRVRYGYVIDFLDVHLGFYRWPTFNIADSCIFCGVAIYLGWSFLSEWRLRKPPAVP